MAARKKKGGSEQAELPLAAAAPSPDVLKAVDELAAQLAGAIAALPLPARIQALNHARTALHEVSPFKSEPVDLVLWQPAEGVVGYDGEYENPNTVAPPEYALLTHSVRENGVAMPLVTHRGDEDDEKVVVDGMHRRRVVSAPEIRERLHGHIPITVVRPDRSDLASRIAATIQFNRARGEHAVDRMSALVRHLHVLGWPNDKIQQELGMQPDEVLRLKQNTGLAALFATRDYSEAWEPDDGA